jgi:ribosomal protein S18 acetylase RimI-like enzyme
MRNMAEQIKIFRASLGDANEILALQKLAYQSEAQIYNDWTIPPLLQTVEEIQGEFSTHLFLKAVSRHSIIGSVRTHMMDNTCHIGRLIVHPNWQNKGVGTSLLAELELMNQGATRFELFTGSHSIKNLHLYHKLGYREFRREQLNKQVELIYLEKIAEDRLVQV